MGSGSLERLQKVLAAAGLGSRRSCEILIRDGRVRINGREATLGSRIDPAVDGVTVDGKPVDVRPARTVCIMLNKPRGYITTRSDTRGRKTVMDLVARDIPGLHPVGRLDYDTEGLLLLTNDGALTYRLTHPSHEVDKTYQVTVSRVLDEEALDSLRRGIRLDEGVTSGAAVRVLEVRGDRAVVEVIVHQGWNRQIRRMFEALGYRVLRLKRTGYGFLTLEGLQRGRFRYLTEEEIEILGGSGGRPGRRRISPPLRGGNAVGDRIPEDARRRRPIQSRRVRPAPLRHT